MKYQVCSFRRQKGRSAVKAENIGGWEPGLAVVDAYGDSCVVYIIDSDGHKLTDEPYDWNLVMGPLTYIDTEYGG